VTKVDSYLVKQSLLGRAHYQFWRFVIAGGLRVYTRTRITGRENVPRHGPFVLAPVHRSYIDTPIAACVTRRRMRFMAKDTMWRRRWVGWLLTSVGGFPVTRGTSDREALRRCQELLAAGEPVVIFPEGERKSGPVVQPLFDGAAFVAARARVPIIPVGIAGSERVMPKGARFIYPRPIRIVIGEAIEPQIDGDGRVPRNEVRRLTTELHAALQVLFDAGLAQL
jgi:1-acyl-sn-glycerol-3-phosphate acyltransferase